MAKRFRVWDEAAEEGHDAYIWYLARDPKIAVEFKEELERVLGEVRLYPQRWPHYVHGTRVLRLRKFPYLVVYLETEDVVEVISVAHGHRREGYWKSRLR